MTRYSSLVFVAAALACLNPSPASAQEELVRFGFAVLGAAIEQGQEPGHAQVQERGTSAPLSAEPRPVVAPMPSPYPSWRVAEADIDIQQVQSVLVDHNGSLMEVTAVGRSINITYSKPRDGLASAGVRPGTLLFQGEVVDGRLVGEAFAFKRSCAPAGYPVSGPVVAPAVLTLVGDGPVRSGCSVSHLDPDSPHSELTFMGDHSSLITLLLQSAQPEPAPVPAAVADTPAPLDEEIIPAAIAVAPVAPAVVAPVPVAEPAPSAIQPHPQPVATPSSEPKPMPQAVAAPGPIVASPAPTKPLELAVDLPTTKPSPRPVEPVAPTPAAPTPTPPPAPLPPKPSLDIDF